MVVKCPSGVKPRFRSRSIKGGTQRLAFCNSKVAEVKTTRGRKSKITRPRTPRRRRR